MTFDFAGKVAIVTGGSSGIGSASAFLLAKHGASVVIADINPKGQMLCEEWQASGYSASFHSTDISKVDDIQSMVRFAETTYGGVDILINSAGIFPRATLLETNEELWYKIMDINLKGSFQACQSAVPVMTNRGGGVIINIGSVNGYIGSPALFAYSTSKGAILTMTKNLARSLAKDHIRVNCVNPGWVVTEGENELQLAQGMPNDWVDQMGKRLPLGRLQTSEDIAWTVLFLASDRANQITGQIMDVDGGLALGVLK